jgi:hypothetical protein
VFAKQAGGASVLLELRNRHRAALCVGEGGDSPCADGVWTCSTAINHLNLNEKSELGGRFSIGKRTSFPHGPRAASNSKLDQPLQIKQEIEFGCRFQVRREDTSLETHP